MGFWNFIGIASKNDYRKLEKRLNSMIELLEDSIKREKEMKDLILLLQKSNKNSYENLNENVDDCIELVNEVSKEIDKKIEGSNECIVSVINNKLDGYSDILYKYAKIHNSDINNKFKKLESINLNMFELTKMILINSVTEDLEKLNTEILDAKCNKGKIKDTKKQENEKNKDIKNKEIKQSKNKYKENNQIIIQKIKNQR